MKKQVSMNVLIGVGVGALVVGLLIGGFVRGDRRDDEFAGRNMFGNNRPGPGMMQNTGSGMMAPATPPALTDAQKAELALGAAVHSPKALTFDVNGGNFYFVPNEIHVKKGDTVTINFKNDGGFHDFKIDAFNVATDRIQGGDMKSVTFTADKTGSYEFYCSVGSHRTMGMKGTLVVE